MTLLPLAVIVALSSTSFEDGGGRSEEPKRTPAEQRAAERTEARERYQRRAHQELSFGYLGEWRDDTQRSWEQTKADDGAPNGSGGLVTPFTGAPFYGLRASGLAFESRSVWDGVRFTLGARLPFASFRMADTTQTVDVAGTPHELVVRSLHLWEVRTGLGYEVPFQYVTPFVDVLGDVQTLNATITLDGAKTTWSANGFSLGARAGLRLQVSEVFLVVAGEATVLGSPRYGASFQAGVAF